MKIWDVFKSIDWISGSLIFSSKNESNNLIAEYFSNSEIPFLENDFNSMMEFSINITDLSLLEIEDYIVTKKEGFIFIENQTFAKIGGSHDFKPSIIYNIKNKSINFFHPNTKEMMHPAIDLKEFLMLFKNILSIIYLLE